MPSKKSNTATRFCKICHRKIEENSFFNGLFTAKTICLRCFSSLNPHAQHWVKNGILHRSLFTYTEEFKSLIYLYKECGDIELAPVFLERFWPLLKLRYFGYTIVPAPSSESKIAERQFDHLPLMFEQLRLPIVHALIKTSDVKQSDCTLSERKNIGKSIKMIPDVCLGGKRILLVDDIYTTGSTIAACLRLILKMKPKKVSVLVVAKVQEDRLNLKGRGL